MKNFSGEKQLNIFRPKPLDIGVRHWDQDIVPSRGPLDGIVLLRRKMEKQNHAKEIQISISFPLLTNTKNNHVDYT